METAAQQALNEAFKYDFLIGFMAVVIVMLLFAIVVMWKYLTKSFGDVVRDFRESLDEFKGMMHEFRGFLNSKQ